MPITVLLREIPYERAAGRGSRPGGQRSVCGGWGVRFVGEPHPSSRRPVP